ncbi:hypothetical protein GLYMA_08G005450v4 [Glycine max]|nr:hypothetical protein GLYMA_08G005450v4 [Glycine max]KAH1048926.1 hypothetical protein GYH30_019825 [Glycine max]
MMLLLLPHVFITFAMVASNFSEWLRRSKERHSAVLCPQCRAAVHFVGKNHFLRTFAEDMLRADSSLRRSHDEVALLDTYALVRPNLVIGSGKKNRKEGLHTR